MAFVDIVDALRSAAGEGADLTPYDDLTSSYNELETSSAAKIADLESQLAELAAENTRLKSVNYDLLMMSKSPVEDNSEDNSEDKPEYPDDETIDSFMENKE